MLTHALEHAPAADRHDDGRGPSHAGRPSADSPAPDSSPASDAATGGTWRGLLGLLTIATALVAACGVLGIRTWQVGSGLGAALFPVEDVVELAAVAVGTAVAGWTGVHALLALACVLADRRGRRWAAAERTVARHAPAVVRRVARVAAGAGLGLALTAPTAMALPTGGVPAADEGPAVVLDLGWRPTSTVDGEPTGRPDRPAASDAGSTPGRGSEQASLVDRGRHTGAGREPVVVEAGDTLWAIAADGLAGDGPSDAEVADAVVRWHDANRQVLGSDPDLIRPGTVLHQP
ncbi:LysM peptidoglycan-binding domain-containing protein [Promicromonospora sp. NPDC060204]|uniref:LysM peptidoglycan-binding domain-containing protein n=1 Tax=Promicromonospora sp. NPDC060204 TaxID=3347071 RepID=UPI00365EAFF2